MIIIRLKNFQIRWYVLRSRRIMKTFIFSLILQYSCILRSVSFTLLLLTKLFAYGIANKLIWNTGRILFSWFRDSFYRIIDSWLCFNGVKLMFFWSSFLTRNRSELLFRGGFSMLRICWFSTIITRMATFLSVYDSLFF